MKNYKLVMVALALFVLSIGMDSCQEAPVASDGTNTYETIAWMAPEPDNSPAELTEATMEQPFDIIQEDNDYRYCDNTAMYERTEFKDRRTFLPLARILKSLELTDIQKEQVKAYLVDFRLCIKDAVMELRASEKEILKPFNEERKAVIDSFKNGEITRDEAKAQLKAIGTEARTALKNNPARDIACEAMKLCRKSLLDGIGSVLTDEQLVKWNEWLAKLPKIDC